MATTTYVHCDSAEQHVPKPGEAPPCARPDCPGEQGWHLGYGLAGGGCWVYHYCGTCEQVIDKTQDPEGS